VDSSPGAEKVEVGVLSNETPIDPSEINLSGFLTVVGEDDRPNPTLFSFPSRHQALPRSQAEQQKYTVSFLKPTGLHPMMKISFPAASSLGPPSSKPPSSICALHTYLTLPSPLFADKYQLSTVSDSLFLRSHNLVALRSISGETDLEAPDYVVERWGSNLLFQLATPDSSSNTTGTEESGGDGGWNVTIPLHLRYLPPAPHGHSDIEIPWPIVFWACAADEGAKFPVNPFDRVNLGYEGLFGGRTMFYHVDPHPHLGIGSSGKGAGAGFESNLGGRLVERIRVPVLGTAVWAADWVEWGTVLVVLMGFAWVCWRLRVGYTASSSSTSSLQKEQSAEATKKTQ
jgi:PIG-X / PBN1